MDHARLVVRTLLAGTEEEMERMQKRSWKCNGKWVADIWTEPGAQDSMLFQIGCKDPRRIKTAACLDTEPCSHPALPRLLQATQTRHRDIMGYQQPSPPTWLAIRLSLQASARYNQRSTAVTWKALQSGTRRDERNTVMVQLTNCCQGGWRLRRTPSMRALHAAAATAAGGRAAPHLQQQQEQLTLHGGPSLRAALPPRPG